MSRPSGLERGTADAATAARLAPAEQPWQHAVPESLAWAFIGAGAIPDVLARALHVFRDLDASLRGGRPERLEKHVRWLLAAWQFLAQHEADSPRDPLDGALLVDDPLAALAGSRVRSELREISTGEHVPVELERELAPLAVWAPSELPPWLPADERARYPRRPRSLGEIPPFRPEDVRLWIGLREAAAQERRRPALPPAAGPQPAAPAKRGGAAPPPAAQARPLRHVAGADGTRLLRIGGRILRVTTHPGPPESRSMGVEIVKTEAMAKLGLSSEGLDLIVAEVIHRIAPPIGADEAAEVARQGNWSQTLRPWMDEAAWKGRPTGSLFPIRFDYRFLSELDMLLPHPYAVADPIRAEFELPMIVRDETGRHPVRPTWEEVLRGHSPLAKTTYAWSQLERGRVGFPHLAGKVEDGALLLNGAGWGDAWTVLVPDMRLYVLDRRGKMLDAFVQGVLDAAGGVALAYAMINVAASIALPGSSVGLGASALLSAPRQALMRWLANPVAAARGLGTNLAIDIGFSAATGQVSSFSDIEALVSDPEMLAELILDSIGNVHRRGIPIDVPKDLLAPRVPAGADLSPRGAPGVDAPRLDAPPAPAGVAPDPSRQPPPEAPPPPPAAAPGAGSAPAPARSRGGARFGYRRRPGAPPPVRLSDDPRGPLPDQPRAADDAGSADPPPSGAPTAQERGTGDATRPTGAERGIEQGADGGRPSSRPETGTAEVDAPRAGAPPATRGADPDADAAIMRVGVSQVGVPPRSRIQTTTRRTALVNRGAAVVPRTSGDPLALRPIGAPEPVLIGNVPVVSRHPHALVGARRHHHRQDFLKVLEENPDNPLRPVLDETTVGTGALRFADPGYPRRAGKMEDWELHPEDMQSAHASSHKGGDAEVLVMDTRWRNQRQSHLHERPGTPGAVAMDEAVVIDGLAITRGAVWDLWRAGLVRLTREEIELLPVLKL